MDIQLVVFELAEEHYGLDIGVVEGIIKMQAITTIPHAPAFVEGVTNLRGEVLPVIDLRKRFGLSTHDDVENTRIVVVELEHGKVGITVDDVSEVLRVSSDAVEPPSALFSGVQSGMLKGVAKVDERLILLLDIARLFTTEEHGALKKIPEAA